MGRKPDPKPVKLTVTRYQTPDGKRCRKSDPGAVKVTEKTDSYYLLLPTKTGKKHRSKPIPLGTTDISVAWKRVRDILAEQKLRALGMSNEFTREAERPIADHLDEWIQTVAAGDASELHVRKLRANVAKLVSLAGWQSIADIKRPSCLQALAALRDSGVGAGTRQAYLHRARQFAAWLVAEGRLQANPLAGMKPISVDADRRHVRRIPTEQEVRILFDYLDGQYPEFLPKVLRQLSGPARALCYQVAMCTGLRGNEVRSLTWDSFDLPAGEVHLAAKRAKNRKQASLPLPRWLADKLTVWRDSGGGLWGTLRSDWPGSILAADLPAARAAWIAAAGDDLERKQRQASTVCCYELPSQDGPLFVDFHSLRHWYITQLAASDGISPSTLLALSRHTDPRLTLGVYAKVKAEGRRSAVEQIKMPD